MAKKRRLLYQDQDEPILLGYSYLQALLCPLARLAREGEPLAHHNVSILSAMSRQPDFTGVWIKVERAKHHFRDLQTLVERFLEAKPYRVVPYDEPDTGDLVHRVEVFDQPPLIWSAIAGDCVHNLRSSLDLLVCEMVRANGRPVTPDTAFYIAKSADAFKSGYNGKIQGTPKCAVDLIKKAKPYQGANNPFWRLHQLDIEDKHKLLVPIGVVHNKIITTLRLDDFSTIDHDPTTIIGNELVTPPHGISMVGPSFPLEDGAEIYRVPPSLRSDPRAQMHVYPKLVIEIAFGEVEVVEGEPIIPTLGGLIKFVEGFVKQFPPLFS
jgi:hypothetical protein